MFAAAIPLLSESASLYAFIFRPCAVDALRNSKSILKVSRHRLTFSEDAPSSLTNQSLERKSLLEWSVSVRFKPSKYLVET